MEPGGLPRVERRLAAILAADVAGHSRVIEADEEGTLSRLKGLRTELIDPKIAGHRGRIVKTTGDGLLVEFASVVDALRCAAEVQAAMANSNAPLPPAHRIEFRIGVNVGDIVVEDGDIFGDGVNVGARLEGLAEPGGICVSARVQEDAAGRLELAFEDMGEQVLKNIARPVRPYRVVAAARPASTPENPGPPLPDKPSIAVLPFADMSGDPEQEYFADGIVEEIITALSRIRWLFVIARNSSFTYKGQTVDVKQVGRELGVRYVLEGAVRKAVGRVRITAQLIDAANGTHLWADRFDGSIEDVFALQDQVAISIAGVIEPTLQVAETARRVSVPTNDLTAYDLYLRALAKFPWAGKEQVHETRDLLCRAIARDLRYGPALAWAAVCHMRLCNDGLSDDSEADGRKGVELARRALQAARDDPGVLANAAFALAFLGDDIGAMMALVDRAFALNPSYARGWYISGVLRGLAGHLDLAIEHVETSLRLSPRGQPGAPYNAIGTALLLGRRFDEAIPKLLVAVQDTPGFAAAYRALASCYAHLGRLDDAREIVNRLRTITPVIVPSVTPFRNAEHRELFLSGLRVAAAEAT